MGRTTNVIALLAALAGCDRGSDPGETADIARVNSDSALAMSSEMESRVSELETQIEELTERVDALQQENVDDSREAAEVGSRVDALERRLSPPRR